ncbi:MAG: sporulation protein [Candidatus Thorarchaeota archaeon]|nr:sporulation protein [Candidatus Thorarchaeota archaeon]
MREVQIVYENKRVLPGETLIGKVYVKTDNLLECNKVVLKVKGREHTEYSSGDTKSTDERYHISRVFKIGERGIIGIGVTEFPFSVQIPRGIPPSYQGYNGTIEYTTEAVVEMNWTIDPKCKKEFRVIQERPPIIKHNLDSRHFKKTCGALQVEIDDDFLGMQSGLDVRFKVSDRSRVKGVSFEIVQQEKCKCDWHDLNHKSIIVGKYCPFSDNDLERWKELSIGEQWMHHLPFRGELIHVSYYLKVALDISLGFDPEIIAPLKFADEESIDDSFDKVEDNLDWF